MPAPSPDTVAAVLQYADASLEASSNRLFDLLRIPSISAQPDHRQDCLRAAEWVREQLVGLVSERDLFLLETVRSVKPEKEPVEEAMTERPYAVAPTAKVREVVEEMLARRYGSAVVVDRGRVVGIFTRADALRALRDLLR